MNKILTTFILGMFLINLTSAVGDIGIVKQNDCIDLYNYCPTCSYINLTAIQYPSPNSSVITMNLIMTKTNNNYVYEFCNTSLLGEHSYTTCGDKAGVLTCEKITFEVTKLGSALTIQEAIIYILLTLSVLGLFLLSLYFTIAVPYSNKINDAGAVIKITKSKYIKLGLILLSYVLFVWVLNVLIGVSDNFVSLTMYYGFISFLFDMLNNMALPVSIFILILMFFEIIRDANIMKAIKQFGSSR